MDFDSNILSFEHNLKHSLLTINSPEFQPESYETRMLLHSQIPDILPAELRRSDENILLQYDISGVETLATFLSARPLGYRMLATIMQSIDHLLDVLEEYLLPESALLLHTNSVFVTPSGDRILFTLLPGAKNNFPQALSSFLYSLLKRIDYQEDRAVIMGYRLYQETQREFFKMEHLMEIVSSNLRREEHIIELEKLNLPDKNGKSGQNTINQSLQNKPSTLAFSKNGVFQLAEDPICAQASQNPENPILPSNAHHFSDSNTPINEMQPDTSCDTIVSKSHLFPSDEETYSSQNANAGYFSEPFTSSAIHSDVGSHSTIHTEEEFHVTDLSVPPLKSNVIGPRPQKKSRKKVSDKNITDKKRALSGKTLETALKEKAVRATLKGKLLFSISLMIFLPVLFWFLKGRAMFQRMIPILVVLEIGIMIVMGIDLLIAKIPEEETTPSPALA